MKLILSFAFLNSFNFLFGQDLYDYKNTIKYYNHLYHNHNYNLLLNSLNDTNEKYKDSLALKILEINSYFALKQPKKVITLIGKAKSDTYSKRIFQFYDLKANLLLMNIVYDDIDSFDIDNKPTKELLFYNCYLLYLKDSMQIKKNEKLLNFLMNGMIEFDIKLAKKNQVKSPTLAAILSILPGLGQAYSKQYFDATIGSLPIYTFSTISILSYLSIKEFSPFVLLNMSLAGGFYGGNIYGAYKSAKRINEIEFNKKNDEIKSRINSIDY